MKGIILSILLLATAGVSANSNLTCRDLFARGTTRTAAATPLRQKTDLKIVSLNTQRFFVTRPDPAHPDLVQANPDPSINPPKTPEQIAEMRRVLRDIDADILVLQEVVGDRTTLAIDPHHQYIHMRDTPRDPSGIHTVFLVKASLYVDVQLVVPDVHMPHAKLHRGLPYIKIRQKNEEGSVDRSRTPDLIVMGVHLKPYRNSEAESHYSQVKAEEVEAILQIITKIERQYPDAKLGILGDLNADLNVQPELVPLKNRMQDTMAYSSGAKTREGRANHTFHTPTITEASQLDGILVNRNLLPHLIDSYVYRYKDQYGIPKSYRDSAGNQVAYPTTYDLRQQNISDHSPTISIYDLTKVRDIKPIGALPHERLLKQVYRDLQNQRSWGLNDSLQFYVKVNGDSKEFLNWLLQNRLNSFIGAVENADGSIIIRATFQGLGYLLLQDSANPKPWIQKIQVEERLSWAS